MSLFLEVSDASMCPDRLRLRDRHAASRPCQGAVAAGPGGRAGDGGIATLPVRRVVLYKNGVGYFEHVGRVRGSQSVTIDFNTAQLNDVLKSLTTLDLGDGRIADVSFNSEAPFAQRLSALGLPVGERTTLPDLLGALRGARLEVRSGDGHHADGCSALNAARGRTKRRATC